MGISFENCLFARSSASEEVSARNLLGCGRLPEPSSHSFYEDGLFDRHGWCDLPGKQLNSRCRRIRASPEFHGHPFSFSHQQLSPHSRRFGSTPEAFGRSWIVWPPLLHIRDEHGGFSE